jgi:putative transposase
MATKRKKLKALPTIWRVPDELWNKIKPVISKLDPPKQTGRKRIDARAALDAIIFRMRTGCQWNRLPKEFPDDSSVHRTFQRWITLGVLDKIWAVLVEGCQELGAVDWQWQAADTAFAKARFGGTRLVQTPRIVPKTA